MRRPEILATTVELVREQGLSNVRVVDVAHHFILFQPVYQIAVRSTVKDFPLTAAGWMLDLHGVTSA